MTSPLSFCLRLVLFLSLLGGLIFSFPQEVSATGRLTPISETKWLVTPKKIPQKVVFTPQKTSKTFKTGLKSTKMVSKRQKRPIRVIKTPYTPLKAEKAPQTKAEVLFEAINEVRAEHGLAPLRFHAGLTTVSQQYAQDMRNRDFFSHKNPEGRFVEDRLRRSGIPVTYFGENLAKGQHSVAQVMQDWEESPRHWEIFLSKNYTHAGVGIIPVKGNQQGFIWVFTAADLAENG